MGVEVTLFPIAMLRLAIGVLTLAAMAFALWQGLKKRPGPYRVRKGWLILAGALFVGFVLAQQARVTPKLRLDTGGVIEERVRQAEELKDTVIDEIRPDVTDSFRDAIDQAQERLNEFRDAD